MVVYHCLGSYFLIPQVKQYTTEGLGRSREGLKEAASHRERFLLGRKVGAAAASAVILFDPCLELTIFYLLFLYFYIHIYFRKISMP